MPRTAFGLVFFCIALFHTPIYGQSTAKGYVIDAAQRRGLFAAHVYAAHSDNGTITDSSGFFELPLPPGTDSLLVRYPFHATQRVAVAPDTMLIEMPYTGYLDTILNIDPETYEESHQVVSQQPFPATGRSFSDQPESQPPSHYNTEDYAPIAENTEQRSWESPISTFSIDVDRASYSNVRRFLRHGQRPPKDAVRIEEMINYFDYGYEGPETEDRPFALHTELSICPWNNDRHLLHIGLQGRRMQSNQLPPSNLVFLLDVSGSMVTRKKLGLVKKAMRLLVEELRPKDQIAIVVYAGAAGLVLPSTPGSRKQEILDAIGRLEAGGSTAGGAGIQLAYQVAREHFLPEGNNRVILATDGDFNIGVSSDAGLTELIEEERASGVFLSVLAFGQGNYKDNKMELLADRGNGNYAYIDNLAEAKKVFVEELPGTLFAIAKDVKLQLEFNPGVVHSYRLVGYENRLLDNEDFANDSKDAGELGAGHSVTALYEIDLQPAAEASAGLRYQKTGLSRRGRQARELAFLQLRYKAPEGGASHLRSFPLPKEVTELSATTDAFRFSAAVAAFGMKLRGSNSNKALDWPGIKELAAGALGEDAFDYRAELLELVTIAEGL